MGVARTCGPWRSSTDPEEHRSRCTECQTSWGASWWMEGPGAHFPAPGALKGAGPRNEPAAPWLRRPPNDPAEAMVLFLTFG